MASLPKTAPSLLDGLTDRELLMLVDAVADRLLDEGAADELASGLGAAFERIELTYGNAMPYPFGNCDRNAWVAWRAERDAALAYRGVQL